MLKDVRQFARFLTACVLLTVIAVPSDLTAQTHVVSPSDMQKEMVAASQTRERNRNTLKQFLSSPIAEKTLKAARIDPVQVKAGIASLNDEELARLAARADKAQADFAAGRLSDRDLIIILIGIVALVLIIVAVR